ncbi:MAG: hypothetical protein ABIJ97_08505 [Bacteroidota bacterium]
MAKESTIYQVCANCRGTGKKDIYINGEKQEEQETCSTCEGTGKVIWGQTENN